MSCVVKLKELALITTTITGRTRCTRHFGG
jgi:hypothetical protein